MPDMISTDSNSSTDSLTAGSAEAKKQQKPAQPPERPKMSLADTATEWGASDVGLSVVFNLPSMSSAFNEPLPPACSAQLPSGIENGSLPSGNTNVPLSAEKINVQPLSDKRKDSEMDICGDWESSDIELNLPYLSTDFKYGILPPATTNVEMNVPLPSRSTNGNLPSRSTNGNLPPRSTNGNFPPSSVNAPLVTSSDIYLPSDTKTSPSQRCQSKAPVPTDTRDSSCSICKNNSSTPLSSTNATLPLWADNAADIAKSPCHHPVDTGPLSQVGALLDQTVHTHSALLGNEEFLSLVRDIIQQGIETQTQWHHRLIEDRQRHRIAKLEMAQMQICYSKSSSTSPPFSSEHFPEFQDASEDADWVLLNFEKLCIMCKVPEPEWVCFLPDTLKRKALGCYCDVPMGACSDYPMIKAALLKPYDGDPDIHRLKFQNMERKAEETFSSFYQRLQYRFDRWMDTSNVKKFKDCYKPLVLEQLLQKCPFKVRHKILQQKGCTPYQAAQIADEKLNVHKEKASQPKLNIYQSSLKPNGNSNAFVADKENILDFLDFFECRCTFHKLPKPHWVKYLCSKLTGKALDVCLSVPQEHKDDYDFVKAEIFEFYEITPQTHWVKFKNLQRQPGETFTDFYKKLLCHYNRWMAVYEVKTFEQCRNLMVVNQLLTQCPTEVQSMTCKQRTLTPEALARIADEYLILHPDLQQNQTSKKQVSEVPPTVRPTRVTFQDGSTFPR